MDIVNFHGSGFEESVEDEKVDIIVEFVPIFSFTF